MNDTWCIAGIMDGAGVRLVESLLDDGHRVAVITRDVSPLAMLVNEYADAIFTLELNTTDEHLLALAVRTLEECLGEIDRIAVVPAPGFELESEVAATLLGRRWPDATLTVMSTVATTVA